MSRLIPGKYSSLRVDGPGWRRCSRPAGGTSRWAGNGSRLQTLETPAVDVGSLVGWEVLLVLWEEIGLSGMRLLQKRLRVLLLLLRGLSFPRKGRDCFGPRS